MTYCLGITTSSGLIMAADSRTNAGVDKVSTFQKLFDFSVPGERAIVLCTSGSLSLSQGVLTLIRRDIKQQVETNLYSCPTLYHVASYMGSLIRKMHQQEGQWLKKDGVAFSCRFIVGGQILGEEPELYLIYNEGNFIHATQETPYFQIGETKYGKPILDRTVQYQTPLETAAKCALLSIDATIKSNLSVGPPILLVMYETDSFEIKYHLKLSGEDPYLIDLSSRWQNALKEASEQMPDIPWRYSLKATEDSQPNTD
ncbi:peptidase [Synechococcales cyanobacterium C]|uniref:Peptidase n=1 Tax=Petrachloros mirabilis ULC683 TaxID=2781853 RepID=A0A8K2A1H1_9CYAN|nr:proteasome-type protease [Petrachloros mirabilis]NCJ07712.1 peptidase [Petrachloros mirabilis ULC683]